MDIISSLKKSRGHDTILVVDDKLSKYTAQHIDEIFVKEIVRLHGIPKSNP